MKKIKYVLEHFVRDQIGPNLGIFAKKLWSVLK